jgi:hypothetical protein
VTPIPVDRKPGKPIAHIVSSRRPVLPHIPFYLSGAQSTDFVSFIQRPSSCLPQIECTPSMRSISLDPCEHSSTNTVIMSLVFAKARLKKGQRVRISNPPN